jgi:glycosyltransferase involved in cell wall biosynthesis
MVEPASPNRSLRVLELGMNWFDSGSGGLDRVFFDLVQALPGVGIGVTALVLGPSDIAVASGGRVLSFGRPGARTAELMWRSRRKISALIAGGGFDLVASHFAMFTLPALDCLRRVPLVVHFHGPWGGEAAEEGSGRLGVAIKRMMERLVYRRADRVIVLSHAFAKLVRDEYGVAEERIRIVPGSVDIVRFRPVMSRDAARERLGWPKDRRILLSVRRLARRMGLDRLILAMPEIIRAEPTALLLIAGRGRMAETLEAQLRALSLEGHVRLIGFLPDEDLPLAYRAAEINLVPTVALEGFGLTTVEALAAGTPSMVTPVGGLPEIVADLSPRLIFRSAEASDIAHGLIQALSGEFALPDADLCMRYAAGRYGAEIATAAVAAVYREVA